MRKNLIVINGTMGIGKSTLSEKLKILLPNAVMLDGDWCWDADPFIVNDVTKDMVIGNIAYLLTSFLGCGAYENVIFCWVMNEADTFDLIKERIEALDYKLYRFSLMASDEALKKRILSDIAAGKRSEGAYERSVERVRDYEMQDTVKIDVSNISADIAAHDIYNRIYERLRHD